MPSADGPNVPTRPLHHFCLRIQAMVSAPSRGGSQPQPMKGTFSPSESNRPRMSWKTQAWPRARASSAAGAAAVRL